MYKDILSSSVLPPCSVAGQDVYSALRPPRLHLHLWEFVEVQQCPPEQEKADVVPAVTAVAVFSFSQVKYRLVWPAPDSHARELRQGPLVSFVGNVHVIS